MCECVGQYKKVAYEEENIGELIKVRHFQWIWMGDVFLKKRITLEQYLKQIF